MQQPLVEVENLVIRTDYRRPFRGRAWVTLFLEEELRVLGRAAQATLFTAILEASPRNGVLRAHRAVLRGLYSKTKLALALEELEAANVILKTGDWILINPALVYSGPGAKYAEALEAWNQLQGVVSEAQEEEQKEESEWTAETSSGP